jgi:hypothetical protein
MVLTITKSRKKRHAKIPAQPENFNSLRASSRAPAKFAAHSIRETGKANEAIMFRDGLGIGTRRQDGDNKCAHRFRLRRGGGRDEFGGEGNQVWQVSNLLIAA